MTDRALFLAAVAVIALRGPTDPMIGAALARAVEIERAVQGRWVRSRDPIPEDSHLIALVITQLHRAVADRDYAASVRHFGYLREAVADWAAARLGGRDA